MPRTTTAPPETLERLERALVSLLAWLNDRETLGDLAQRSGHDLAPASWSLLEYLDARGSMRVSDIAACHGVHTSSITPRLQRLEQAGLIQRSTDPADARVSIIAIAPAGVGALQSIHAARQEALAAALTGCASGELDRAAEILSGLAEGLRLR
ncbi:MarR family transcriptional regulator [Solirubrobacter ginsenosidimutans]|uniref:MarR family transcriptional regulator n=1 Tax=Solirubrobacter ginsenosidimutans TaxID=490573 RepID=A0A9X3S4A1_9ACTN|nr:MarR family transcriptional regulator [Solirubrobacter ginsenosidimutans]MDA0162931.1 MarR family transcriptional regulator [Solirubrobacter ginsenosidimutans]